MEGPLNKSHTSTCVNNAPIISSHKTHTTSSPTLLPPLSPAPPSFLLLVTLWFSSNNTTNEDGMSSKLHCTTSAKFFKNKFIEIAVSAIVIRPSCLDKVCNNRANETALASPTGIRDANTAAMALNLDVLFLLVLLAFFDLNLFFDFLDLTVYFLRGLLRAFAERLRRLETARVAAVERPSRAYSVFAGTTLGGGGGATEVVERVALALSSSSSLL